MVKALTDHVVRSRGDLAVLSEGLEHLERGRVYTPHIATTVPANFVSLSLDWVTLQGFQTLESPITPLLLSL